MYTPASFKVDDLQRLHELMRRYPFALLLTEHDGCIEATHLPFMVDAERSPHGTLLAHMARANPHWKLFDGRRESLVVFTGAHAYISPSWYESPVTVPTWNYAAVHAHGRPVIVDEKARVRAMLERLVTEHEAYVNPPWSTAQAGDYIDDQINYIVAFEIPIERLKGKFKFNQNRSRADQEGVVHVLSAFDEPMKREVAEIMRNNLRKVCTTQQNESVWCWSHGAWIFTHDHRPFPAWYTAICGFWPSVSIFQAHSRCASNRRRSK